VSNEEYLRFFESTGYLSDSEVYGWSFVFDAAGAMRSYRIEQLLIHVINTFPPFLLVVDNHSILLYITYLLDYLQCSCYSSAVKHTTRYLPQL
jgi:hypothetical protein